MLLRPSEIRTLLRCAQLRAEAIANGALSHFWAADSDTFSGFLEEVLAGPSEVTQLLACGVKSPELARQSEASAESFSKSP